MQFLRSAAAAVLALASLASANPLEERQFGECRRFNDPCLSVVSNNPRVTKVCSHFFSVTVTPATK